MPSPVPRLRLQAVSLALLATVLAVVAGCRSHSAADPSAAPPSPAQYAWTVLVQSSVAGTGAAPGWESWATPGQVFAPVAHAAPPSLPPAGLEPVGLMTSRPPCPLPEYEVAHLNPAEVDYIQSNHLTTAAGLQQWFAQGRALDFPASAISLKAVWKVLGAADNPADYVTGTFGGVHYGLQGINLAVKAGPDGTPRPQWLWATFENIRNRCYWTSTYRQPDGFGFPDGQNVSSGLKALLASHHLDSGWLNYRLVGVQVDPAVRLGNSSIEADLPTTSSCLACHSESRFNSSGVVLPPLPFHGDAGPLTPITPAQLVSFRQLDFVWAFLCLNSPTAPCQSLPDAGARP